MVYVCKFGGTSLANAERIHRVYEIIKDNPNRKYIVVSAPGKENANDIKVTDLLIKCAEIYFKKEELSDEFWLLYKKFEQICDQLNIDMPLESRLQKRVKSLNEHKSEEEYFDYVKATGERLNAELIARYLLAQGVNTKLVLPEEYGLVVSSEFGNALPLHEAYNNLKILQEIQEVVVIPGFYGITKEGKIATFARGGSDLTGAVIAKAVNAEVYENFTDVDGIFAANPKIVANPKKIDVLTYEEMRELSYMGTTALQEEAVFPCVEAQIPIHLRNTFNYPNQGTLIVNKREPSELVSGIAVKDGFISINIKKWLMNREKGFCKKLFDIVYEEDVSFEHMPGAIDNLSLVIHESQLGNKLERLCLKIKEKLRPDSLEIDDELSLICVVGIGMKYTPGIASRATGALAREKINIRIMNQGASEINMIFGVKNKDAKKAVNALYKEFFM
ncbi:MAG: aspartate kinase [Candidatus Pacearchaeota archaeon]